MHGGSCFCGAIRYRLTSEPMVVHCCHCRDCQKQTSAAFVINAIIEHARVEVLSGTPAMRTLSTDSGRPHDVSYCPDCGSVLWSDYGRRGVMLFLRAATLDDPAAVLAPPMTVLHIFTRSKSPAVALPDGARAFEVYYDMAREWPAEARARRAALLGEGK